MAYQSTVVTKGHGHGIVVATGMSTEMGKIAKQLNKSSGNDKTPLQKKLDYFAYILFGVGCVLAVAVYGANQWDFSTETTLYAIALAIAYVIRSCFTSSVKASSDLLVFCDSPVSSLRDLSL
jgi:magnesium-transporting ATPase (P-type)